MQTCKYNDIDTHTFRLRWAHGVLKRSRENGRLTGHNIADVVLDEEWECEYDGREVVKQLRSKSFCADVGVDEALCVVSGMPPPQPNLVYQRFSKAVSHAAGLDFASAELCKRYVSASLSLLWAPTNKISPPISSG